MAGAGYKLYATGDVLSATDVNSYLQQQTVMVFASAAARTSALSLVLAEGMISYLIDTDAVEVYNGSAWVGVANAGDITGVTAGTGISGGGTSGTVTVTNSMATAIDAKGDLIGGTGADTFSRLAVGADGTILTADSAEATGLKWATPAGGTQVAVFTDAKASGAGGTFTSGAWRTRDINTSQFNSITGASIASNQITLPAGTFIVQASAPYARVDQNQARFQNVTDASTAILGQNNYVDPGVAATGVALVQGAFTIAGTKTFELQHQGTSTRATDGFGVEVPFSTEVYSIVSIWKVG